MKILGEDRNFLGIEKLYSSLETSRVVIVPAPYNETTKTKECPAPETILAASKEIPLFDEETKREIHREAGIATLAPLVFTKKQPEGVIQHIYDVVYDLLQRQKFVTLIGGSHSTASPAIAAHAKYYPRLSVLHFSARSDLQPTQKGFPYSSASTMNRVLEFLDATHVVQVGVRSQTREEAELAREKGIPIFYAHNIRRGDYTKVLKLWDDYVVEHLTDYVYLDIDLSVFDPSIFPAVTSPQPFGLPWDTVLQCIRKVARKKTIVGCNVVELSPIKNLLYPNIAAAKLITKVLNYAL